MSIPSLGTVVSAIVAAIVLLNASGKGVVRAVQWRA
jgi:hypothetical protein